MKHEMICRVCLEEGEMKPIFTTNCLSHIQMTCAEAILKLSSVSAKENDGLPKYICKKCLSKLKAAYKFKILCEDSYLKLTQQSSLNVKPELIENFTRSNNGLEMNIMSNDRLSPQLKTESANEEPAFNEVNQSDCDPSECVNENIILLENGNDNHDALIDDIVKRKIKKKKKLDKKHKKSHKIETDHKLDEISEAQKQLQCNLCEKTFISNHALKKHEEAHAGLKPYFCQICNEHFRSGYSHKALHSKDRKLQCEICAKVFLRAATLRMHLLAHRNELPFRCAHPGCEKAFPLNSRLQLHMKVHTNERNFICQYCSHAARDKQQLTVHIRYFHTKEKNFLCGDCGKAFVSPQARYYHAKRHENIRNHHCPHCDKSFVFAFGLQEHLVTHTGERRFACSVCEVRFSRKAHKEKHEVRLHGIKKPPGKKLQPLPIHNFAEQTV